MCPLPAVGYLSLPNYNFKEYFCMDFLRAPSVDGPGSADAIAAAKRKMKNFQKNIPWVHRQHAKCTFCVSSVDLTRDAKSFWLFVSEDPIIHYFSRVLWGPYEDLRWTRRKNFGGPEFGGLDLPKSFCLLFCLLFSFSIVQLKNSQV